MRQEYSLRLIFRILFLHTFLVATSAEHICIELTARFETGAPDGVEKEIITINGQFPGPTIRARRGDTLTIRVNNKLTNRKYETFGTSVHWHGLEMVGTPWFDGPEMVTQCEIPINSYMDYHFNLVQSGTYWYHSHHGWQYVDGFWGLLIVDNSPAEVFTYEDEFFITLMDWHWTTAGELSRLLLMPRKASIPGSGEVPDPDSALINGYGNADCAFARTLNFTCDDKLSSKVTIFNVLPGKTYRIRLINPSAGASFQFSIDGHKLRTIETDGVDTFETGEVDQVRIWPAQRYSFLVTMDKLWPGGNAWVRAVIVVDAEARPWLIQPLAVMHYLGTTSARSTDESEEILITSRGGYSGGGSQGRPSNHDGPSFRFGSSTARTGILEAEGEANAMEGGSGNKYSNRYCHFFSQITENDNPNQKVLSEEYVFVESTSEANLTVLDQQDCLSYTSNGTSILPPDNFDVEIVINVTFQRDALGYLKTFLNLVSYSPTTTSLPAIFRVMKGEELPRSFVPQYVPYRKVIQVVINNLNLGEHPLHLHGHTFWVMGTGAAQAGAYDAVRDAPNLVNRGLRRDVTDALPNSWSVIRYVSDNPGVWFFHCHINWHLEIGFGAVFVEAADKVRDLIIPKEARRVCKLDGFRV